ncbi:unnamed protein product [Polarella glacialis]|uniref:Mannosyltransferase n=1 Tax=Polarella glacialis TaxID=89957 RepID=A0A813EWU6_POLGL|nr:unnamed protein product [Polarella glacialis]
MQIALWLCFLGCLEQELLLFLPISSFSWRSQAPVVSGSVSCQGQLLMKEGRQTGEQQQQQQQQRQRQQQPQQGQQQEEDSEDNSRADELDKASTEDEEDEERNNNINKNDNTNSNNKEKDLLRCESTRQKVVSIDTQATNSSISSAFEADFWGVGLGAAVALLSLGAYARGLHQGLPGGDGAELCTIAALYPRAIAHPPGYPLATMFGSISLQAARNLWGNDMGQVCPAVTLGMSPVCGLGSVGQWRPALCPAALFGVTPLVYQWLNNALAVALLLCTSSCLQEPVTMSRLLLGAFICGLGVTNQHILVFLCVAVAAACHEAAAAAGLSPYLVPCAASRLGPLHLHSWAADLAADISSPQGLLAHILRREYGSFKLGPEFQVEKAVVYQDEDGQGRVVGEAVRPHSEDAGTELKEDGLLEELASLGSGARQAGGTDLKVRFGAYGRLRAVRGGVQWPICEVSGRAWKSWALTAFLDSLDWAVALLAVLGLVAELWAFFSKASPTPGCRRALPAAAGALANLPLEDSLVHRRSVIPRFWSQPQLLVTLLAARGLAALCPQVSLPDAAGSRRTLLLRMIQFSWLAAIALGLLLASCQAVKIRLAAAAIEGSGDMIITQYYSAVLTALPNRSILLVSGDMPSMTLRYLQAAQGLRPDVEVLCWELLSPAMFSLQGQRWEQLGVRLPAPPHTRDDWFCLGCAVVRATE